MEKEGEEKYRSLDEFNKKLFPESYEKQKENEETIKHCGMKLAKKSISAIKDDFE